MLRFYSVLLICISFSSCQVLYTDPLPREACFAVARPNIATVVYPQDIRANCNTGAMSRPYFVYRPRDYFKRSLNTIPYTASTYIYHGN